MTDIFEHKIICNKCKKEMKPIKVEKNGFLLRAVQCEKCKGRLVHPKDEAEYEKFINLKNKTFKMKMRVVGNSYTVSIPKEIVAFMKEQEKIMDDFVRVAFNEAKKLSLMFGDGEED